MYGGVFNERIFNEDVYVVVLSILTAKVLKGAKTGTVLGWLLVLLLVQQRNSLFNQWNLKDSGPFNSKLSCIIKGKNITEWHLGFSNWLIALCLARIAIVINSCWVKKDSVEHIMQNVQLFLPHCLLGLIYPLGLPIWFLIKIKQHKILI